MQIADIKSRVILLKRIIPDYHQAYKERLRLRVRRDIFESHPSSESALSNIKIEISLLDKRLDELEKEVNQLGGAIRGEGVVYFLSQREGRKIFVQWCLPDQMSWHEIGETFLERVPL